MNILQNDTEFFTMLATVNQTFYNFLTTTTSVTNNSGLSNYTYADISLEDSKKVNSMIILVCAIPFSAWLYCFLNFMSSVPRYTPPSDVQKMNTSLDNIANDIKNYMINNNNCGLKNIDIARHFGLVSEDHKGMLSWSILKRYPHIFYQNQTTKLWYVSNF